MGYDSKILLANQFSEFFNFDLFDLLILILGVYRYIVVVIPPDLFEESKPFILVEILYCEENESGFKHFIKKFEAFTNYRYRIAIKRITRKVKSLFKLKSEIPILLV